MPASIGVNLRVTGHCSQGGRKYMEDLFSVAYQQTEDERDLEYAFFGIYDGHGGSDAAVFAKEHLMDYIVKQRQFWSDNDEDVLKAIRNGFMLTHLNMWKEIEKWPKTGTGLPSTAGTTASIAFIRRGKIYIGHVGDSAIVLGYQKDGSDVWAAKPLTCDHKPESTCEMERIQRCGGKVVSKAGVPRVVWNRPRPGHKGPIKKSTPMDEIPFLAVARSLGDLWSYNALNDEFIVSPDPDVGVLTIDPTKFRCLIFGTDGLWNMISPEVAVSLVQDTEKHNEAALVAAADKQFRDWLNPSKSLVDTALERWLNTRMRADNTSVVTLMLDPPGPPRATVLRARTAPPRHAAAPPRADHVPQNGLTILTRFADVSVTDSPVSPAVYPAPSPAPAPAPTPAAVPSPAAAPAARPARAAPPARTAPDTDARLPPCATIDARFSVSPADDVAEDADAITNYGNPAESYFMTRLLGRSDAVNTLCDVYDEIASGREALAGDEPAGARSPSPSPSPSLSPPPPPTDEETDSPAALAAGTPPALDGGIQINEVSSSSPVDRPQRPRGRRPRDGKRAAAAAPQPHPRVLRSHDVEPPPRPHTRQRAKPLPPPPPPPPPPALERVVILSRARGAPAPSLALRLDRPIAVAAETAAPSAATAALSSSPASGLGSVVARATRSRDPGQKGARTTRAAETRPGGAGNCTRAPGPARRDGPAARGDSARECFKENCGAVRRRPPTRAPAPAPRPRPADSAAPEPEECRALRSRNSGEAVRAGKRAAPATEGPRAGGKTPRLAKRTMGGPWAPALALRQRLRKRLAK